MIRLYGSPITRAQRVMWMLQELGLAYEQVPAGVPSQLGALLSQDAVRELNPSAKLPVLEDGDFRITESLAINLYLAMKYPGELTPVNSQEWGHAFQWTSWALNEVDKDLATATVVRRSGLLASLDAEQQRRDRELRARLQSTLGTLESALARRRWLAAERFTVADLNVAAVLALAQPSGVDLGSLPHTRKWLAVTLARPAARSAWGTVIRDAVAQGLVGDLDVPEQG